MRRRELPQQQMGIVGDAEKLAGSPRQPDQAVAADSFGAGSRRRESGPCVHSTRATAT